LESRGAGGDSWANRSGDGLSGIIAGQSYFLLGPNTYTGEVALDWQHSARWGFSDDGVSLRLMNESREMFDLVNYGINAQAGSEAALANLSSGSSLERKASATSTSASLMAEEALSGNAYDTDTDEDLVLRSLPEPQNSQSQSEPREPDDEEPPENEEDEIVELLDQFIGDSSGRRINMNFASVFGQSFTPSSSNITSFSFILGSNYPESTGYIREYVLCSGDFSVLPEHDPTPDWNCDNPGQKLLFKSS
jgi:hypothetical protein